MLKLDAASTTKGGVAECWRRRRRVSVANCSAGGKGSMRPLRLRLDLLLEHCFDRSGDGETNLRIDDGMESSCCGCMEDDLEDRMEPSCGNCMESS